MCDSKSAPARQVETCSLLVFIAEAVGFTIDRDSVGSPGSVLKYDPTKELEPNIADYCSWMKGIDCRTDQTPSVIAWGNRNLTGVIPAEINRLQNLWILWLADNNLQGTIPTLNMPELIELDLANNNLVGPFPTGNFPKLRRINMNDNALTGTIPGGLDKTMPVLVRLHVGNNHFGGLIPSDIPLFHNKHPASSIECDFVPLGTIDTNHWECPMPDRDTTCPECHSCILPTCEGTLPSMV